MGMVIHTPCGGEDVACDSTRIKTASAHNHSLNSKISILMSTIGMKVNACFNINCCNVSTATCAEKCSPIEDYHL